jgi:putative ABC transport system permease protein
MLKNYIKTALRNLFRNKLYSFLNIAGLAIGIACCVLILLYVQDELSFDRFHENSDNIYRLVPTFTTSERTMYMATNAHVQGPMLKSEFPEVLNYVRFTSYGSRKSIEYKEMTFNEEKFLWADGTLFDVFSFKLVKGSPKNALVKPNSLVITEERAEKYFGDEDPMGKTLLVNNDELYMVTGVMENVPKTSHMRPDFIASFSTFNLQPTANTAQDLLMQMNYYTYLLVQDGTDHTDLEQRFTESLNKQIGAFLKNLGGSAELELQPLTRIYLHSDRENEMERTSDVAYVYLFSGIGLFILLLACLNFMNLSTARSANRAKEVGLRKVVGALRGQLIKQFLGESMILTLIAVIFSLLLVIFSMPVFNNISGKDLGMDYFFNPVLLVGLFGLFVIISLIGGSYPAFFLSAFRPVEVIQGKLKRGAKSSVLRIALVSFQFTVSIVLIIGTLIVSRQLNYVKNRKLGYDKDHVVSFRMRNPETQRKYEVIKNDLIQHPSILDVSASTTIPLGTSDFSVHHAVGKPEDELIMLFAQIVDEDYIGTYKMEIVQGRNFSKEFPTDPDEAIIINEAAVKKLGWQDVAIGQQIERFLSLTTRKKYRIVGIVNDYHFQSLHREIQPLVLFNRAPYDFSYNRISVRVKPANIQETIGFLKSKWKEFDSQYPFEYAFVDDQYDELYRAEERLGQLFGYFTALAIVIGCLGLFGLTSFAAEQRTKEIGGYLVMNSWLQNFFYRINVGFDTLILAALLALIIAIITVSYQAVKAALANPADSLKYE